jgi:hypothetical protein
MWTKMRLGAIEVDRGDDGRGIALLSLRQGEPPDTCLLGDPQVLLASLRWRRGPHAHGRPAQRGRGFRAEGEVARERLPWRHHEGAEGTTAASEEHLGGRGGGGGGGQGELRKQQQGGGQEEDSGTMAKQSMTK